MLDALSTNAAIDIERADPIAFYAIYEKQILFHPTDRLDVYCQDDCPSLRPHRETARGFASRAEAVEAGLRPCGWCRPDAGRPANGPRPAAIRRAGRTLAELFGALVFLP
jgi:methylphosphotriester-DNA--protein-cysteine methyltransferase